MRVLLAGAGGQLGAELQHGAPSGVELLACDRQALDITDPGAVQCRVAAFAPEVVINAAAYTRVDDAEADAEAAFAVNAQGARHLAAAAASVDARCILVSTDFVFEGSRGRPYGAEDRPAPRSVYGQSKLAGEQAVAQVCGQRGLVVRTSWLYSARGENFVKAMLRLMRARPELGVVADQVGSPTWAAGLAGAVWEAAMRPALSGYLHWSDAGVASWYDFAVAIQDLALAQGLLQEPIPIKPLTTAEFPRPAPRPSFSVLDNSRSQALLETPRCHWRTALGKMLEQLQEPAHA